MLEHLENASLFEIYQTSVVLKKILGDPKRMAQIRSKLAPHQVVSYFNARTNQAITATVVQLSNTKVLLRNHHDGKNWQVPYYMINLGSSTQHASMRSGKVDSLSLRVGDSVGFVDRQNRSLYGVVQKLNRKTASLILQNGEAWRVAYEQLFHVMEAIPIKATAERTVVLA
ncbi:MAG: hypothetical protein KBD23_06490 [Gammaproteobacteria bacterium]|nr:hypothetical protein [Gammaproteobacteria bacterium]